jgi:hypothetical protein
MEKPIFISDLNLSSDLASFVASVINVRGDASHPVCRVDNLNYFYVSYLKEIFNKPDITKNMSEKGVEMAKKVKHILDNL